MGSGRRRVMLFLAAVLIAISAGAYGDAFIDAEELKTPETKYGLYTGNTPQAVCFGKSGELERKWWIAGYDGKGLVLMCDPGNPFGRLVFEDRSTYKAYDRAWNCAYGADPDEVAPNHYGVSAIRVKTLARCANLVAYFSRTEQRLMKAVPVYTCDYVNKAIYSTADKLYLPTGELNGKQITVGSFAPGSGDINNAAVNNGLKIGLSGDLAPAGSPFPSERQFWLRAPYPYSYGSELIAHPQKRVFTRQVYPCLTTAYVDVLPVLEMDADALLFASTAETGKADAAPDPDGVARFRFDVEKQSGIVFNSTAEYTSDTIRVSIAPTDPDIYLYVQWSSGSEEKVKSCKVSGGGTYSAADIAEGLDLRESRIWLERVVDRVAYAKFAVPSGMPAYVILDRQAVQLKENESVTLQATVLPEDADEKGVIWSSSDSSVASVDRQGKVTWKGPGTAVITVIPLAGGDSAFCTVTCVSGNAEEGNTCPSCGNPVKEGQRFCGMCGFDLSGGSGE